MKNKSIKTQILIPILALLLFGNILQVIIVSSKSTATANELSTEIIEQTVQDYSNKFQSMASEAYGTLAAFVPVALTMRQGENPREELINNIKGYMQNDTTVFAMWTAWEPNAFDGKDSEYANTSYLDGTGRYVPYLYRSGDDIIMEPLVAYDDAVEGAYYQGVKSSGKPRLTDPYLYSVGDQQVQLYSIALPVFEDGKFIGAIGMDIDMETIATNMDVNNILGDGYIFTISPGGLLATHPHEDLILKDYRDLWLIDFDEQLQNLQENKGIITLKGHSAVLDTEVVFSASSVDVGDSIDTWLVCSVVPVKSMTASADAIRTIVITAGALLIVVIAAVTIISLRRALKNMPMLTSVAHTIADGDVMSIALIEDDGCSTRNEVALLMRAFTAMITNIKNQVLALQSIAGGDLTVDIQPVSDKDALNIALRDMVQTNNRVFSEILSASSAVSDVANALSEGSQQLAQAAVEQSASVEELSASITTVAEQAANTKSTAKQASDMTKGIMNSAEKGTEKMNEMVQAVLEIGEASNKINNVIMMIEDIASQTNILALNAAVEAARAGQHGKGFAVVAEEVRTLANKSAEAAHDTAKLISESIRKAELGTDLAKESSELLSEIVEGISTTSDTVARIPVATHEQSLSIDQINISIAQISEAVHQSSATSEESAATSEEMSSQAIMLKELVERFKLD